jgi:hypothetical protein
MARSIESIIFHISDFVDFDIASCLASAPPRSDALSAVLHLKVDRPIIEKGLTWHLHG